MSIVRGVIYGTSKRQKLNTKSSTEAELVGVDDVMPQVLWTLFFIEAQGYNIDDNFIYQDNKSSILLETNGRVSRGKRTRHIAVRYFFIADRVKSKEIRIEYCLTGIMIADYFTKLLQGLIFLQLRYMIMGSTDISLPTDQVSITTDQTSVIPAVSTQQESMSVFGKEGAINPSPPPLKILAVSDPPASGSTCKDVCAGAHTCTSVCVSAHTCTPGCMSHTFHLLTTRGNMRLRLHQH
jgi:hypothetical protein